MLTAIEVLEKYNTLAENRETDLKLLEEREQALLRSCCEEPDLPRRIADGPIRRLKDSLSADAVKSFTGGRMPKKARREAIEQTEAYAEAYERLLRESEELKLLTKACEEPSVLLCEEGRPQLVSLLHGSAREAYEDIRRERFSAVYKSFAREYAGSIDWPQYLHRLETESAEVLRRHLLTKAVRYRSGDYFTAPVQVSPERLEPMFKGGYRRYFDLAVFFACNLDPVGGDLSEYILLALQRELPEIERAIGLSVALGDSEGETLRETLVETIRCTLLPDELLRSLERSYDVRSIRALLRENPVYRDFYLQQEREAAGKASIRRNIVTAIPANYRDLYPETRRLRRRFILHSGPTNSGKTYAGIEALKKARNGVYLAPLRMLALEKFDELNEAGCPCELLTGEERKWTEDARYVSSTIEMADFDTVYDCAVIDECQMITDAYRGGAWTAAILGLQAKEIHLCLSPWAEGILAKLIDSCGDTREYVRHTRSTELLALPDPIRFPQDVRPHDALIVFARRDVHAIAAELSRRGIACSMIYGALPYDVRQNEARRFRNGETQVVVSTDAIGMGLNLPIERVVFLKTEKFDGTESRRLNAEEVRQIAGRAGRRGIYEKGYAAGLNKEDCRLIASSIGAYHAPAVKPMIGFPRTLLGVEGDVSALIREWNRIPPVEGFLKQNLDDQLFLAEKAEKLTKDKLLVYRLAMIPVDVKTEALVTVWAELARCTCRGILENAPIPVLANEDDLQRLELTFKVYDLYFQFGRVFGVERLQEEAMACKEAVSAKIMELMCSGEKKQKTCAECGRVLPWNYGFNICEKCYRRRETDRHRGFGRRRRF